MGKKWLFTIPENTPPAKRRFAEFFRELIETGTGLKTESGQTKGWSGAGFAKEISTKGQTVGTWCNAKVVPTFDYFNLISKGFFDKNKTDPRRIRLEELWKEACAEKIKIGSGIASEEFVVGPHPITRTLTTASALHPEYNTPLGVGALQPEKSLSIIGMPPPLASFIVRKVIFDRLYASLLEIDKTVECPQASTSQPRIGRAVLIGMPGVGKTTIAVEFAHRFRDRFDGVWWCSAETRVDLFTSLAALGRRLGVGTKEGTKLEAAAREGLDYLTEKNGAFLLIYDNVTNPSDIADFFPLVGAQVLITSRFPDWRNCAEEIDVDVLSPGESIDLLESRAGREDAAGAKLLAEALGWLPLALDHAAAFCRRPIETSFADYAAKAVSLIAATPPRGAQCQRSVEATFTLAIEAAAKACPAAEILMAFLGYCAPERIPTILVEGALDEQISLAEAILALSDLSLLWSDPFEDGTHAIRVHRLVQAVARLRLVETAAASHRVMDRLLKIYPRLQPYYGFGLESYSSHQLCDQLTPHLLEHLRTPALAGRADGAVAELMLRAGLYFHERGVHDQALRLYKETVKIRERMPRANYGQITRSLKCLGGMLWEQGDLAGARHVYQCVLVIMENLLGPTQLFIADDLYNLGRVLSNQGDFSAARPILERFLVLKERCNGTKHPSLVEYIDNLAHVLQRLGDFAALRHLLERAVVISEEEPDREYLNPVACKNNLAHVLRDMGDLPAAREMFERTLRASEIWFGAEHQNTAICLNNLGDLLRDQGNLAGAQPLHDRARAIMANESEEATEFPSRPTPLY